MDVFFLTLAEFNPNEIRELIYHRYGTAEMLDDMTPDEAFELFNMARKNNLREWVYQEYLVILPKMQKLIPFDEYYEKRTGGNIDRRTDKEILEEIYALHPEIPEEERIDL